MQISIRDAQPSDIPVVLQLMLDLATQEGLAAYFRLTQDALVECCLRDPKRLHLLVAASETAVVGYAAYMFQYSPWAAGEYLFLDDIYVAEGARRAGVGTRLMRQVGAIAIERNVDVRWHMEANNRLAQKFYTALGAELRAKVAVYWSRDAIHGHLESTR